MNTHRQTQLVLGIVVGFGLGVLTVATLVRDRERRGVRSWLARVGDVAARITALSDERRDARAERRLMRDVERYRVGGL